MSADYLSVSRRHFFKQGGLGLGSMALGSMLARDLPGAVPMGANPLLPKDPHFAPRAKNVIYLHMIGAPSQLDLFDYKPALTKFDGQKCPEELTKGKRFANDAAPGFAPYISSVFFDSFEMSISSGTLVCIR